jgi:hypothetical protein
VDFAEDLAPPNLLEEPTLYFVSEMRHMNARKESDNCPIRLDGTPEDGFANPRPAMETRLVVFAVAVHAVVFSASATCHLHLFSHCLAGSVYTHRCVSFSDAGMGG